jgi:hypothetical protein
MARDAIHNLRPSEVIIVDIVDHLHHPARNPNHWRFFGKGFPVVDRFQNMAIGAAFP